MSKPLKLPVLLVITDNPSIRHWVKKHLEERYFVIEAATKSAVLDALQYSHLDFIILDAGLEECDPIELCKEIRTLVHASLTPILLITGRLKKSFRNDASAAGVSGFLSDQLDLEELEEKISAGKKTAFSREKTIGIATSIQTPEGNESSNSLKNRKVVNTTRKKGKPS